MKNLAFVVEDDSVFQFIISNHLKKKYCLEVICFSTGEKCLEHLSEKPQLIIMDYILEGGLNSLMNGLETYRLIKRMDASIKIVMMTAQDDIEVFLEMIKSGVRDYVIKNENSLNELDETLEGIFKIQRVA